MIMLFRSYTSTKGQAIVFDTDTKEYKWTCAFVFKGKFIQGLYMPTNKDLKELEKKLLKEGYEEI